MAQSKDFMFVRDYRGRYRFLPFVPPDPIAEEFSRARKIWEGAKQKITRLNPRTLLQEQAFEQAGRPGQAPIRIIHSGDLDEKKARTRFFYFLQRQRTRHILVLAAEVLLLPLAGLAAILPGPNIFFYFLAALMIIQGQAVRGISLILRKDCEFASSEILSGWESAVEAGDESSFKDSLEKIEKTYSLEGLRKILWM